ncbi:DUF1883 domain-containing protein [Sphingomonas rosea]|uniref:DUF1883 domain-containing protein n=1 Tax=Sphingomonas rosea TaxID=335605 RepID=UPI0031D6088C
MGHGVSGMSFTHYRLGHLERGSVVEVTLSGSAANVRLMDSSNLSSYQSGRQHRYYGGLINRSPARITVPSSGDMACRRRYAGAQGHD